MPSENKLIKEGIRYNDRLFQTLKRRVTRDLNQSKSLEEFLTRTKDYTTDNILVTSGYQATMSNLILQAMNDLKFQRASQRELVRITIENRVGQLITNVGEDLKNNIRDIVKQGYDEGLHSKDIAVNIDKEIDTINRTRARVIARTEVKRTRTISNHIIYKERGATHFTVYCRPDCCEYCDECYNEHNSEGEVIGDTVFNIDDVDVLPPYHPNCRCSVVYSMKGEEADDIRSQIHVID